jgi:hypothetical protein
MRHNPKKKKMSSETGPDDVMSVIFLGASKFVTRIFDNYLQWPLLGLIPLIAVAAPTVCLIAIILILT